MLKGLMTTSFQNPDTYLLNNLSMKGIAIGIRDAATTTLLFFKNESIVFFIDIILYKLGGL